jgi:hypothetical protein
MRSSKLAQRARKAAPTSCKSLYLPSSARFEEHFPPARSAGQRRHSRNIAAIRVEAATLASRLSHSGSQSSRCGSHVFASLCQAAHIPVRRSHITMTLLEQLAARAYIRRVRTQRISRSQPPPLTPTSWMRCCSWLCEASDALFPPCSNDQNRCMAARSYRDFAISCRLTLALETLSRAPRRFVLRATVIPKSIRGGS